MTNLNKLFANYNVYSHKEKENLEELLSNHLPKEYTSLIAKRLKREATKQLSHKIRMVKSGLTKDVEIFKEIVSLAKERKAANDDIKQSLAPAN